MVFLIVVAALIVWAVAAAVVVVVRDGYGPLPTRTGTERAARRS
ncbi:MULTISPECIES: hypothetical protein [unclassified Rathayibacter]|nr:MULTISPECIES: hypothetical protein [unclassified Rathayibacter]